MSRLFQEAPAKLPNPCTPMAHTAAAHTQVAVGTGQGRPQPAAWEPGRLWELREATRSPDELTYREWETKSYTGICTVFPSVISLSVLKMSSLSKASEGNQTV